MSYKRKLNSKAFTLIEVLVAISIFAIVISAPTGFFISSLKAQRKALKSQELLDNTSYAVEYMSRALRMAKKDINGDCIGASSNFENPDGKSTVKFLNYKNQCQKFFLVNNQLKEEKNGQEHFLTSDKLEITSLKFELVGQSQTDNLQPKVTISLKIQGKDPLPEIIPKINIQTTISQRNLDVIY